MLNDDNALCLLPEMEGRCNATNGTTYLVKDYNIYMLRNDRPKKLNGLMNFAIRPPSIKKTKDHP